MSESKPTNHGQIKPVVPPAKPVRRIPQSLRHFTVFESISGGFNYQQSCERYGVHRVIALRDISLFHQAIRAGDTVEVPGNLAIEMFNQGEIVFDSRQLDQEQELIDQAARLQVRLPRRDDPAFQGTVVRRGAIAV